MRGRLCFFWGGGQWGEWPGEGHCKHWPEGDLASGGASLLTVHAATQTLPIGPMLHYSITNHTALSHLQMSAHCTSLQTCRLTRNSKTTPHRIGHNQHIALMSTEHSICSSWVRWCALQWHASFPDILMCVFRHRFQNI